MRVAICDSNAAFLEEFKGIIEKDSKISKILTYTDSGKLITDIENKEKIDVVFIDIGNDEDKKGIYYASRIYKINKEIHIIYMTEYLERYSHDVFLSECNLTGCMLKPVDENILNKYLNKISIELEEINTVKFVTKGAECILSTESIMYLESDNHKTIVHIEGKDFSVYEKLGSLERRLPKNFVRCHQSFLVNMDNIRYIDSNSIIIGDNIDIPVSRSRRDKVKDAYFKYKGESI